MKKILNKTQIQKSKRPFFITHKYDERDIVSYQTLKPAPILYVKNLTKKYFGKKKPAINNISFNVFPGEFHAFIGANGAGKTTTIKCLIGAYANWNGTVLINGHKNNKEIAKKKLGYIPESARFPEKLSAIKYLQ
jgi:ABC-2 type transport system ATP-binding protein